MTAGPRLRAARWGHSGWEIVAIVILGAVLASPVGSGHPHRAPLVPSGTVPIWRSSGPSSFGNSTSLAVLGQVALSNGSFRAGDVSGLNGISPTSLAYNGIAHRLYVGVAGPAPGVIVIDPHSGAEVARWSTPGGAPDAPRGLAYDPTTGLLAVAEGSAGNVSLIDTSNGTIQHTAHLGLGTDPVAIAVDDPDNQLAVVESSDDAVALLNASTGTLIKVLTVGVMPDAIAYDPVADRLVVANGGGSTVTMIDPGAENVTATEPVGSAPDGVAYDSTNGQVLVANRASDNVTILKSGTLVPSGGYGTGRAPGPLSCTIDGQAVIPNALDNNVTVVDDSTGTSLGSQSAGIDPTASVWDAPDGRDYIANVGTDNLTILNLTVTGVLGTIVLGASPVAVADLPTLGRFAIADPGASAIEEVTAANLTERFRVTLPVPPVSVASDGPLDRLFASEPTGLGATGNVAVLNASTGAWIGSFPVGKDPQGIAFDPRTREVYVADFGNASVSVLDPLNGQLNRTFPIPPGTGHPSAISVAVSANGSEIYLPAGPSNDSITVLNATTGAWVASIATPAGPGGIADDPSNGTLWVADATAGELTEISERSHRVVLNVTGEANAYGVAVADPEQWVFVSSPTSQTVDVINASGGGLLTTIFLGTAPSALAVDNASSHLAIADPGGGDVALVGPAPATFPVVFQESGLADPSLGWTVTVDGVPIISTTTVISTAVSNGSHGFTVPPQAPLHPTPSSGTFVMNGSPLFQPIVFAPPTYNASFLEIGLPPGASWSVTIDGLDDASATDQVIAALPNGTFAFQASTSQSYAASGGTGSGNVTIAGADAVPHVVQFAPQAPYVQNFTESGLPLGTIWSVDLASQSARGATTTLSFRVDLGQFDFTVPTVGGYVAQPSRGQVTVLTSTPEPVTIRFHPSNNTLFPVTFQAFGLPGGTDFSVVLNGIEATGVGSVNFSEMDGNYSFRVQSVDGLAPVPSDGTVTVAGAPAVQIIEFAASAIATPGTFPLLVVELGVGLLVAAVAVVAVLVFLRRRPPGVHRVTGELVRRGGDPTSDRARPDPSDSSGGSPSEGSVDPLDE
jgi:YVTN family beta-propeller protein